MNIRWRDAFAALGKALCYLVLFLGWQLLVSTVYSLAIGVDMTMTSPDLTLDQEALMDAVLGRTGEISLVSGLLTLGSVALLFKTRGRSLRRELRLRSVPAPVLGWSAALSFCLYWLVSLLLNLLPERWLENYGEASAALDQVSAVTVIATALVAPVVEEVIFRGLIFTRLDRAFPGRAAMLLSAALFGACHGELVWFCYAFVLGLVFAWAVSESGSILPSLLMHLVFNTTNEVLLLLDWESGPWAALMLLLAATAGTAFCALHLRDELAARPVSIEEVSPGPDGPGAYHVPPEVRVEAPRESPAAPEHPGWDEDSGMHHRFPAERM